VVVHIPVPSSIVLHVSLTTIIQSIYSFTLTRHNTNAKSTTFWSWPRSTTTTTTLCSYTTLARPKSREPLRYHRARRVTRSLRPVVVVVRIPEIHHHHYHSSSGHSCTRPGWENGTCWNTTTAVDCCERSSPAAAKIVIRRTQESSLVRRTVVDWGSS